MKRLKNQSGFTLAETLLAVLIMLLVSGIVATGIPAARNAYEKVVIGANAQAMLSTAVTNLRDALGTAWKVEIKDTTTVEYFNAGTGAKARLSLDGPGSDDSDDADSVYPAIMLQDYISLVDDLIHDKPVEGNLAEGNEHHLVPDKNTGLYVTYGSVAFSATDPNIIEISGLKVCKQRDGSELIALKDENGDPIALEIRLLSEDAITEE